jgi:hypothetical protein
MLKCPYCFSDMESEPHAEDDRSHHPTRDEILYWCEDCGMQISRLSRAVKSRPQMVILYDPRIDNALDVERRQYTQYGWRGGNTP